MNQWSAALMSLSATRSDSVGITRRSRFASTRSNVRSYIVSPKPGTAGLRRFRASEKEYLFHQLLSQCLIQARSPCKPIHMQLVPPWGRRDTHDEFAPLHSRTTGNAVDLRPSYRRPCLNYACSVYLAPCAHPIYQVIQYSADGLRLSRHGVYL